MLSKLLDILGQWVAGNVKQPNVEQLPVPKKEVEPAAMLTSKKGQLELMDKEGWASKKYLDSVGVQTIGFGSTKSDIKDLASWSWSKELSLEEGIALFKAHLKPYENAVKAALKVNVEQHQFDALVSITYNIGIGGMKGSTFMKRINNKAPMKDIVNAILMWDIPPEIKGRRLKEAKLFQYGTYGNQDGCVDRIEVGANHKPKYKNRIKIIDYL